MSDLIRVVFVCLGNICRSPMAEAVFRHKIAARGLSREFAIDSAGTGDWHSGEPPHPGTRAILDLHGIPWENQRARQIGKTDFSPPVSVKNYLVTMDDSNLRDVKRLAERYGDTVSVIRPLLSFAPNLGTEVPDPYYDGRYAEVYALVDSATDALINELTTGRKD